MGFVTVCPVVTGSSDRRRATVLLLLVRVTTNAGPPGRTFWIATDVPAWFRTPTCTYHVVSWADSVVVAACRLWISTATAATLTVCEAGVKPGAEIVTVAVAVVFSRPCT